MEWDSHEGIDWGRGLLHFVFVERGGTDAVSKNNELKGNYDLMNCCVFPLEITSFVVVVRILTTVEYVIYDAVYKEEDMRTMPSSELIECHVNKAQVKSINPQENRARLASFLSLD
jgi:hypothetical protein